MRIAPPSWVPNEFTIVSCEEELGDVSQGRKAMFVMYIRSRIGAGMFLSYFEPARIVSICSRYRIYENIVPPGAVGGLYGSGCFHFSSNASASWTIT